MALCADLFTDTFNTIMKVIFWIGVVLNGLCIVGWSRILWLDRRSNAIQNAGNASAGNTFKYLLVKAVCDLLFFVAYIADFFAYHNIYSYFAQVLMIYIYPFGIFFVSFLSSLMELLATLGK
jgi:hypothetical protein